MQQNINYQATQTAAEFHLDDSFVRLLFGPVGCGKSVANCIEVFRRATEQEAGSDGIRRSRWGIVRNTYPELKSTTIKTWLEWFPEHLFGKMKWDSPITHRIFLDGIDLEVIFLALDSEQDIKKLMSFEFTGIYINELQYIHPKIFEKCQERVNRYPAKKTGANITWTGVIADTNPPSTRHWIYHLFEKKRPTNFNLYKFLPGLISVDANVPHAVISRSGTRYINNPDADYIQNFSSDRYYLNQVPGKDDDEIKVSILGEYGVLISGKPVHPEYKYSFHYSQKPLIANPDIEIGLGWDFGLTPACAIIQFMPSGQFVVLGELYSEKMAVDEFSESIVVPHLNRYYPWWTNNHISRHDPAGQTGVQTDQKSCQQILAQNGIQSYPAASSNATVPRRNGLKYHLLRLTGGEPGFLVDPSCTLINEGLMGHFQYGRIQIMDGIDTRYHEKPLKNLHSHICEGLEYIAMHYARLENTETKPTHPVMQQMAKKMNRLNQLRERAHARNIN